MVDRRPGQPDQRGRAALAEHQARQQRLQRFVGELTWAGRVALSASVAHRLLPHFSRFHERTGLGEPPVLHRALDEVWNWVRDGSTFDAGSMGAACMEQSLVAVDHGSSHAAEPGFEAWTVANGAPSPLAEQAVHAAVAVALTCVVAAHDDVRHTLDCLERGRLSALAASFARGREAERAPLVEQEGRRQMLDLELLREHGPTTQILARLRAVC
jgi:Protein of unknown function (DUF416)